jgi:DNA gyrase subunit A
MVCVKENTSTVLVVSEKGYGKRSFLNDPEDGEPVYRITNRGGKGVKTINITDKTGPLLAIKNVSDEDDLMIITKAGVTIRMHVDSLRVMGRAAQGVRLINLKGSASIAAVARAPRSEDEEELDEETLNEIDLNAAPENLEDASNEEGKSADE